MAFRQNCNQKKKNLRMYGNGYLPVVGKFEASIECNGRKIMEAILVMRGEEGVYSEALQLSDCKC